MDMQVISMLKRYTNSNRAIVRKSSLKMVLHLFDNLHGRAVSIRAAA
jgi:hypothetical protein